jgi:hypothetical protein
MKAFSEFGITPKPKGFVGNKIKINKIFDKQIIVHDSKIADSKVFKGHGSGKCLCLQISLDGTMHVVFTGSVGLIEAILQIPKEGFPFTTTIREENNRYDFT